MRDLRGTVAWVTGAGTGIGQAAAVALAKAGASVVLTGRRKPPLDETAAAIGKAGGKASVAVLDVSDAAAVTQTAAKIDAEHGRLDILVNNAGLNILERQWNKLDPARIDSVLGPNLNGAFYCAAAALPIMRRRKDGLIVNVASWAGRHVSYMAGPVYSAAKHAVVAMSESINQAECVNGIRSCALCPGEVATPILDRRPVPVSAEDRARMLQSEDLGETILFLARLPNHVCINEILISPTWNRGYVAAMQQPHAKAP
ncbi:MAG TPA: SDR family oxidoreductase [Candidatus Cybelea sp.]|nr:SDR family oxidoreductase [Candidatus Cybelea sp.]